MAEIRTGLAPQDINPQSCQPVQPSSYQLYNVTSATQILRENSMDQNTMIGGRTGYTPLVSVLYDDDDFSDPDVRFFCVHVRAPDGSELPYSRILANGADVGVAQRSSFWVGLTVLAVSLFVAI